VRSGEGEGTSFQLLFPTVPDGVAAELTDAPRPSLPPPKGGAVGLTVLLVEDNPEVRRSLTIMLTAMGHSVSAVRDGEEALAIVGANQTFSCMITDVVMPGMSGHQLLDRTRELQPELPVLLMTGYVDDVIGRDRPQHLARSATIQKPFTTAMLEKKLSFLLGGRN
jgi:CheY-like chemotaxis protein